MSYSSEEELFEVALNSPYLKRLIQGKNSCKLIEPKGLFGIPDLVVARISKKVNREITVISFEMKLKNWRRALYQAFRYRAFSNFSYVILDHDHSSPALKCLTAFKNSNIGLMSLDQRGKMHSHFQPLRDEPYCESIQNEILNKLAPLWASPPGWSGRNP